MNLGAFLVVMLVANATGREDIDGFRGLAWRGGGAAGGGDGDLPVLADRAAAARRLRRQVLPLRRRASSAELYLLALVGVLNSVVSLYYYARIVRTMFLDFPAGGEIAVDVDWSNGALLGVLSVFTVVLGVYWAPVIALADRSVRFLMG